ncbi:MAG: glycoside hydrolase family 3 C-terminal domain-containing protein [Silvibacterium sp.]|nr:glycoside hydrolase family 3 C-terminal domain-containing protein [Silvibacterium sp.]
MNLRKSFGRALLLALPLSVISVPGSLHAQFGQPPKAPKGPWEDKTLSPDKRADLVIAQMTLDEKIQLVHGLGWQSLFVPAASGPGVRSLGGAGFIPGVERLGIPDLQMSDAAVGVARGAQKSRYSTALPSAVAEASSWDPRLAYEYGALIATELRDQGFGMSLGGGVNLTREPRNGRTFEYKGEDPILAGTLVGQEMKGEQDQHIIGDIKHYAVNDQENGRNFVNSILDKRSMRETDLLAFEIGIRDSGVGAVMCSYNKINGTYACENDYTLGEVLKKDWSFPGFVVSDWGGTHSTVKAAMAGLDIEMPGNNYFGDPLKKAIQSGQVPESRLNDMVHRILRTEFATGLIDNPVQPKVVDVTHGFDVAQRVEEHGAVLLKNSANQLPLNAANVKSIAVIGGHADVGVISGGGSGQVDPAGGNAVPPPGGHSGDILSLLSEWVYHRSSPLKAIRKKAPGANVQFDPGTDPTAAAALAKSSDVAIVFVVQHESEDSDLPNLSLPNNQDALIQAVAAANPHTIVVLETGGAVTMPWIDQVSAVLESWYPGIRGGEAIANILFGDVNPSAKLPLTFPKSEADLPHPQETKQPAGPMQDVPGVPGWKINPTPFDMHYDEGLKVGYKWYDAENKQPLFPFGFGLSYTTFSYSDLQAAPGNAAEVTFRVTNTGSRAGDEIAQIYATLPASAGEPPRRLVGWQKVALGPGESKTVTVQVEPLFLSIFDTNQNRWQLLPGEYKLWVGSSSRDLPLSSTIQLGSK